MGGVKLAKAAGNRQGGQLGKTVAPLDEKLKSVKWGEFSYQDFFSLLPIKIKLTKEDFDIKGNIPVYSSESTNNGISGYTVRKADYILNNKDIHIIFGDHTRTFNIATSDFCVMDNVKVLVPKGLLSKSQILFIISSWQKCIHNKGYARHWSIAKDIRFNLPTKDGKIDFEFMESFISELEAQRIAELQAYLTVTGLKDYTLTKEEKKALDESDSIKWGEFKLEQLFKVIKTSKLNFKAADLPKQSTGKYVLPCLTSSFNNQGLNYYVPTEGATILKNVISIPSNSDVYRAYFQSNEFTVLSDAYAIHWFFDNVSLSPNEYLFAVQSINKVTDLPIYSYKNKLGGWNVVKNKSIQLPVKNGKPDYDTMDTLISAIKKQTIKDVVLYADRKIAATKVVVNQ